ncbi:mitogen-activated protein kinase kinase kinase kinase 2-like [Phalacrocorax aristotelis]|uniref:mitogen-activated protein kinase kinase kinase kinase 2-like n=1 Tax=Phalacrocorax aristotelis TaxID=126867 RepID=UPI003F4C0541
MGACFAKVLDRCSLRISAALTWAHPETRDLHLLLGADEGLFALNLRELQEDTPQKLLPQRCTWLHCISDVLLTLAGQPPQLLCHDLPGLLQPRRRLLPRRGPLSSKVPHTKGCLRCCVAGDPRGGPRVPGGRPPHRRPPAALEPPPAAASPSCSACPWPRPPLRRSSSCCWCRGGRPPKSAWGAAPPPPPPRPPPLPAAGGGGRPRAPPRPPRPRGHARGPGGARRRPRLLRALCLAGGSGGAPPPRPGPPTSPSTSPWRPSVTQEVMDESRVFRVLGANRDIILESRPVGDPQAPASLHLLTGHQSSF